MNILIITEGGQDAGFGHITRCISLCQAFEEKNLYPLLIINGDLAAKNFLKDKNCIFFNWLENISKLEKFIKSSDLIIVDSILAEKNILDKITEISKLPVFIDDFRRLEYKKGIVIDWTIFVENEYNLLNKKVHYLAGSKYTSLRKAFWDLPENNLRKDVKQILITMGGSDPRNITPKILELFINHHPLISKKVIIGKGFRNIAKIEKLSDENTDLIYYPDDIKLVEMFTDSDIVISASGQTLYELAGIGTPTIAVSIIDNQKYDIEGWEKAKFIEYAGSWNYNSTYENILTIFNILSSDFELRLRKKEIGRNYIDGQGARRIIDFLLSKSNDYL